MARNASGVMTLSGEFAVANEAPASNTINGYMDDILNEITDSLSRSGKGGMLDDLDMGTNKITGLANGTVSTDAATTGQIQTSVLNAATSVGGTVDAITATFSPQFTSYIDDMAFRFTATGANTVTAPTINVSGLGNKTIKKLNGQALIAGDISGAGHICNCVYDGTDVILLNPATGSPIAPTPAVGDNDTSIATTAFVVAGFEPLGAYVGVNDQTGTTYTFVLTDAGKLLSGNNAAAITWTVPPNSSVAFPVRSKMDWWQKGAGQITFAEGSGVTIRPLENYKSRAQYSSGSLIKIDTDEWLLIGDITP